ncbi:MAG: hypothetical protein AAFP19_15400 [Bacteroidota bacterium]
MPKQQNDFRRHLEDAILEEKHIACPNLACQDIIRSQEIPISPQYSIIAYQCGNPNCEYHQIRQFQVDYAPKEALGPKSFFPNARSIRTWSLVLVFLIGISLVNYLSLQRQNVDAHQALFASIEQALPATTSPAQPLKALNAPPKAIFPSEKSITLDELAQQIKSDLDKRDLEAAKDKFKHCLRNPSIKNSLLDPSNRPTQQWLLKVLSNSYRAREAYFSYSWLRKNEDFEQMRIFIETFAEEDGHLMLARALYNLPYHLSENSNPSNHRAYQLEALEQYLIAGLKDQYDLRDDYVFASINELLKSYHLFKYNPKQTPLFKTIESAIDQRDKEDLRRKIAWVRWLKAH